MNNFTYELDFSCIEEKDEHLYDDFQFALELILKKLHRKGHYILCASICDDDYIHKLNKEYRDMDKPTDVLSFAYNDGTNDLSVENEFYSLGDIYIDKAYCDKQCAEYSLTSDQECVYLFIHGVLHLFGYDHIHNEDEKKVMFDIQNEIFNEYKERM